MEFSVILSLIVQFRRINQHPYILCSVVFTVIHQSAAKLR